jgi:hypothetical protein
MEQICERPLLADSVDTHPTESLKELIEKYYAWEIGGGQRASLFMPSGAAAPKGLDEDDDNEEWTFSTTADFEKYEAPIIERMSMRADFHVDDFANMSLSNSPPSDDYEPFSQMTATNNGPNHTPERVKPTVDTERRVERGARALHNLFDESSSPYKYSYGPSSDLPLRSNQSGEFHKREISVGSRDESAPKINLDLNSLPKNKKPDRSTMTWVWENNLGGSTMPAVPSADFPAQAQNDPFQLPVRPMLKHSATEPVGIEQRPASTLDLDSLMGNEPTVTAKRETLDLDALMRQDETITAKRETLDLDALMRQDETITTNTSRQSSTLNLDDYMNGTDISSTVRKSTTLDLDDLWGDELQGRKSHMYAQPFTQPYMQSAGSSFASSMAHSYNDEDAEIGYTLKPGHGPADSIASSALDPSDVERMALDPAFDPAYNSAFTPGPSQHSRQPSRDRAPLPMSVSAAALVEGAPPEVVMEALTQQIGNWTLTLQAFDAKLQEIETAEGYLDDSEDDEEGHEENTSQHVSSSMHESGNWSFGEPDDAEEVAGHDDDGYHGEGETTGDDGDDADDKI